MKDHFKEFEYLHCLQYIIQDNRQETGDEKHSIRYPENSCSELFL